MKFSCKVPPSQSFPLAWGSPGAPSRPQTPGRAWVGVSGGRAQTPLSEERPAEGGMRGARSAAARVAPPSCLRVPPRDLPQPRQELHFLQNRNLLLSSATRINLDYRSDLLIKAGDLLIKLELPAAWFL